jgi:hypothetical protein
MTLDAIKAQVMYQTNNDRDDLPDFEPHLTDYINEGYDILVMNYTDQHVASDSEEYPLLKQAMDVPRLPEYTHRGLADYATFCVYRNGNAVKQNRGMAFYSAFLEIVGKLKYERGGIGRKQFKNIFTR